MANENIEKDKLIEFAAGDIFYTQLDDQFHLYKLLQHDEAAEAYHVLSYVPFSQLPSTSEINTFKVAIYHLPMRKDSFVKKTLFAKHTISYSDLIGYHEYLKQTQEVQQYIPVARDYYNAAFQLTHKEDFVGAIDHYSRVIDLLPDYVDAIDNRAFCNMHLQRWAEAVKDFKTSLILKPGVLLNEFSLGKCFEKSGDPEKAKIQFEKTLAIDPAHQQANELLQIIKKLESIDPNFKSDMHDINNYPVMIQVEGGSFTMGNIDMNGEANEQPTHVVTVKSFKIAKTPTTFLQWEIFSDATGRSIPSLMEGKTPDTAMGLVNWFDAVAYCEWLSATTGNQYRLPTEAEWEYAARGGKLSKGYLYSGSNNIDEVAWYKKKEISENFVQAVAQKRPNELGLYDMSGNVWEWCSDWYAAYTADAQTNPQGPNQGEERVQRGGSCTEPAASCRITFRNDGMDWLAAVDGGFRVVLEA